MLRFFPNTDRLLKAAERGAICGILASFQHTAMKNLDMPISELLEKTIPTLGIDMTLHVFAFLLLELINQYYIHPEVRQVRAFQ